MCGCPPLSWMQGRTGRGHRNGGLYLQLSSKSFPPGRSASPLRLRSGQASRDSRGGCRYVVHGDYRHYRH
jgi:hypothetical protein